MRADNTGALGRAPAWEQGSASSCGYRVSLQAWRRNGWQKMHREVLPAPRAVLWINHTHLGRGANAAKCWEAPPCRAGVTPLVCSGDQMTAKGTKSNEHQL